MGRNNEHMQHAIILPNEVVGSDAALAVEYAIAAEEAGWDAIFPSDTLINPSAPEAYGDKPWDTTAGWSPEKYQDYVDAWIVLAGAATRTSRIKLGTYVTPLPRRQPWQVAKDIATLDRLSNGRIILGVGLGLREDYEKFGIPWEPKALAQKYDEALEIIDRFWKGERFTHHGQHYTVENVALLPTPLQQPRVPILIAGYWPNKKPFQRGARWDGIMPLFSEDEDSDQTPEQMLKEMLTYYHSITDDPGDIVIPIEYPGEEKVSDEFIDICKAFGVTWLLTHPGRQMEGTVEHRSHVEERIRRGPLQ